MIKQSLYDHGGSRICYESDEERILIADSYTDKDFAEALMRFVEDYYGDIKPSKQSG